MATIPVPTTADPLANMASLQSVLDAAARGDTITLTPRAVYRGSLTLRNKAGSAPILITTNLPSALPVAGTRLAPLTNATHLSALPILEVLTNNIPAVKTCDPAAGTSNFYTLRGLEIRANTFGGGDLVAFGSADTTLGTTQDSAARVPTDLILDRCWVHGLPFTGQKRGVALHCLRGSVIENYISDCWGIGQDTQAIGGHNGLGTYVIRNNYLEAAGEVVLMGGSDPIIANLVPTDLLCHRNDITRPASWRSPILSTPTGVVVNIGGTGGTLPAATYSYRVMARCTSYQSNVARSTPAAAVAVTITLGQLPQVSWSGVTGATSYYIYRIGPAGTQRFSTSTSLSFADTGATGVTEAVPGTGTVRAVKNLFELKNFDGATVVGNRLSNHWTESQPGPAVVFTPVNQDGGNNNTVVQNVLFAYNRVDHVAAVYNCSSHDAQGAPLKVSRQANHITIRHNLHTDVGTAWGTGNLRDCAMTSGSSINTFEGIDHFTYEHNTTLASGMNAMVYFSEFSSTLGFPKATNLIIRNNLARRGGFGINGSNSGEGNLTLTDYATAATCTRNAIVGIATGNYPAGNFGPTETTFQAQFVDYAGGNYRLAPTSIYKGQATDGTDLGAEIDLIDAAYAGTLTPPFSVTWLAAGGSGTLTVSTTPDCPWSAVSDSSWITITNGANHVGPGTVTYTVASNSGVARQGTMTVAGTSVTIVQTSTGVAVVGMPVGALVLAGAVPVGKRTFLQSTGVGALSLAGSAVTLVVVAPTAAVASPAAGMLTLVGAVVSLRTAILRQPGVGALTVASLTPIGLAQQVYSPGVGALVLAGLAITRATTGSASPGVGALLLLGRLPTRSLAQFPAVDVGSLTLTGQTPTRLELVPRLPGVGALVLAGAAVTLTQAHIPPTALGALTLAGLAPSAKLTLIAAPAAGALIVSSLPVGAASLFSRVPETGVLTLAGLAPAAVLAFTVSPGVGALVLAGLTPVRTADTTRQTLLGGLVLQGHLVGSFATYSALTGAGPLTLAGLAPSLGQSYLVEPGVGALVLAGAVPSRLGVGTAAPAAAALMLLGLAPDRRLQVIYVGTAGALLLNGLAPAVTISGGTAVTVAPSQAALTLTGLAPLTLEGVLIAVPPGVLLLQSLAPPIFACQATVTPTLVTVIAAGGIVTITVDISATCDWTAVSNDTWLTLTPDADTGSGTVLVTVAAYLDTVDPREGTLDIAGTRVVIVQVAAGCAFTVAPASIHASGQPTFGSLTVTTTTGCSWAASTADPWITLTDTSGTGSGAVSYALAANPLTSARHGTITVAGQLIPVLQLGRASTGSGGPCPTI